VLTFYLPRDLPRVSGIPRIGRTCISRLPFIWAAASGNPSALGRVETAESGAVAARQVGEALCRPRAALGSNYSERPISAPFPRVPRGSTVGGYIYGRKLDKRVNASRSIGRRLLRVAFSSRWYAAFDDGEFRVRAASAGRRGNIAARVSRCMITVLQLWTIRCRRACFSSELCITFRDIRKISVAAKFHDAYNVSH